MNLLRLASRNLLKSLGNGISNFAVSNDFKALRFDLFRAFLRAAEFVSRGVAAI